jgi:hypothetical protein
MSVNFLGTIVLMLLTVVGYSSGAVIAGRGEKKSPQLLDLGVAVLLMAMAWATSAVMGRQIAIAFWFILAGLVSALLTKGRYRDGRTQKGAKAALVEGGVLRRTWDWWKTFGREVGNYQGRLLFAFFYFIVVTPFGIGVRLFSDPLKVNPRPRMTRWSERDSQRQEFEAAREQF